MATSRQVGDALPPGGPVDVRDRIPRRPFAWTVFPIVALMVGGIALVAVLAARDVGQGKAVGHDIYRAPQFGDELRCEIITRSSVSRVTAEIMIRTRDDGAAWETQRSVTYALGDRTPTRYMVTWLQDDSRALTGVEVFAAMPDSTIVPLGVLPLD